MKLVSRSLLIAVATLGAPAAAHATLVNAQPDGVLSITAETSVAAVARASGVGLSHTTSSGSRPIRRARHPHHLADHAAGTLNLASGSACAAEPAAAGRLDHLRRAAIDHVAVDSATGRLPLAQELTDVGDHTTADPTSDPALIADLGRRRQRRRAAGRTIGTARTARSTATRRAGGNDLLIQPDVADPATQDAGTLARPTSTAGRYSRRTNGQGVTVTTQRSTPTTGARRGDTVRRTGRGTSYNDTLIGSTSTSSATGGADMTSSRVRRR